MRTPITALPPYTSREHAMKKRRRFKQTETLQERLRKFAADIREQASQMPPSAERDQLVKKARQADTAAHLDEWMSSPGLQSPK